MPVRACIVAAPEGNVANNIGTTGIDFSILDEAYGFTEFVACRLVEKSKTFPR